MNYGAKNQPYFGAVKQLAITMQNVTNTSYIMVINYITTLYHIKIIIIYLQIDVLDIKRSYIL